MPIIPEFPCSDCGVNTCPLDGNREYYMVSDEIWHLAGGTGIGYSDNGVDGEYLCIGCFEHRLGRRLKRSDFDSYYQANNPSPWLSERLNERLGLKGPFAPRELYYQFFPKVLLYAAIVRYSPKIAVVDETGGAGILIRKIERKDSISEEGENVSNPDS